ncbi:hypothetical protein [Pseudobutyrivibrio sp. MD2005]|uniref:hypothetical protein n=1 Tax=Pseudobutyrivibrio sp. MD2005 TaxID=1410616 RepID=UPI0004855A46|nr:hypothetical protein [Pseudobutyrivibrio sp. MD2005]
MENRIFRKKTLERISSPEQLTDYLRVTAPGVWVILTIVVLLFVGFFAWTAVGTITTYVDGKAVVTGGTADIVITGTEENSTINTGMTAHIASTDYVISSVDTDEYGRAVAHTKVDLADGTYDARVIVEQIHPIKLLTEGR